MVSARLIVKAVNGAGLIGLGFLMASCAVPDNPLVDYEEVKTTVVSELPKPVPAVNSVYSASQVKHGRYLVGLLGCSSCHTSGALAGSPEVGKMLAGSTVGIAYSNPLQEKYPGVVYPANLTPDMKTGLGRWQDAEITKAIRMGIDRHGRVHLPVMPWSRYARINDDDALAIVAYLRSLSPIDHSVPKAVSPGQKASYPYVHFGIYQSRK